jgi:galactonate dehydratase
VKINAVETFRVPPRWLFCKISTDEGLVGWGEPVVEGRAGTVQAAVDELSDYLIGSDALRIEDTWQVLTKGGFYRGGAVLASAVAGIDQALWDIAGKAYGVPVHALLGGLVRDKARIYGGIGGHRPAEVAENARRQRESGLTAVKMTGSAELTAIDTPRQVDLVVERVAAVREAVGPDCDVAIDFHGRFSPAMARRVLPLLEPYLPFFVEEPLLPELSVDLARLVGSTPIPIATGERLYSRWDFREVLASGIAVAQPDVSHAGGISETRRIAAMAEAYGVSLAPHCPLGPIALAACLQVDLATPNFLIQEQSLNLQAGPDASLLDYLVDRSVFRAEDGYLPRPTGPGLGIEVDEAEVRRVDAEPHRWRNVIWRHRDGSLAEW